LNAPETIANQPPAAPAHPRRLIRVLTTIATLILFTNLLYIFSQNEWDGNLQSHCIELSLLIVIIGGVATFLYRVWTHPTAKTDRAVLLCSLFCGIYVPLEMLSFFLPDDWRFAAEWTVMLLTTLGTAKWYDTLEPAWTKAQEIYPLPANGVWPSTKAWLSAVCGCLFIAWLAIQDALGLKLDSADAQLWMVLLPFLGTFALYHLGLKIFNRSKSPTSIPS